MNLEILHPLQMNSTTSQKLIQGQKDNEALIQDLKRQVNII